MYPIIVFIILALMAITIIAKLLCFNKHIEDKKNEGPYKYNRDYYIRTFKLDNGSSITVWFFETKAVFEFYRSVIDEGNCAYLLDTKEVYCKNNQTCVLIANDDFKDIFEHLKKDTK